MLARRAVPARRSSRRPQAARSLSRVGGEKRDPLWRRLSSLHPQAAARAGGRTNMPARGSGPTPWPRWAGSSTHPLIQAETRPSIAALVRTLARIEASPAREQYETLHAWTMPEKDRRAVRILTSSEAPQSVPAASCDRLPARPRPNPASRAPSPRPNRTAAAASARRGRSSKPRAAPASSTYWPKKPVRPRS